MDRMNMICPLTIIGNSTDSPSLCQLPLYIHFKTAYYVKKAQPFTFWFLNRKRKKALVD